jgi:hypothetical protein
VIISFGGGSGEGVIAWADVATDKTKPITAINLSIALLLPINPTRHNAY